MPGGGVVGGDFDGDGRQDMATVGLASEGAQSGLNASLPVAFSKGDGSFQVTQNQALGSANPGDPLYSPMTEFLHLATDPNRPLGKQSSVKWASGDFDADGKDDFALLGGHEGATQLGAPTFWSTVPVAFSRGLDPSGFLKTAHTNKAVGSTMFQKWAADAKVKVVVGNFNGAGGDDIALVGGAGWTSIPVALSNGNGSFTVSRITPKPASGLVCSGETTSCADYLGWAADPNAKAVAGDFNGDGADDISLAGGSNWTTVPVAYSTSLAGGGAFTGFTVRNDSNLMFAKYASDATHPQDEQSTVKIVAGDYNHDGKDDLAAFGAHHMNDEGANLEGLPMTLGATNGQLTQTYKTDTALLMPNVMAFNKTNVLLAGGFNHDQRDDLVVTGDFNFTAGYFANPDPGGVDYLYDDDYIA
ncbi:hypothetical protein [Streptomyces sp. 1222.5]|uniref:hypothetical protein n=1 Tax=Streptomyces sp. 1222.5 TaxID=1881026 RepID=UPI003EB9F453